ncbi:MAG: hypothetical protein R3C11_23720 [Planctomycetaceae bacterium]
MKRGLLLEQLWRQLEQGPPFEAPIEYRIYGPDLDKLKELGDEVRCILAQANHVLHTRAVISEDLPKIGLEIDEVEARLLGFDHTQIAQQMNGALEGYSGDRFWKQLKSYQCEYGPGGRRGDLEEIMSLDLVKPEARVSGRTDDSSTLCAGHDGIDSGISGNYPAQQATCEYGTGIYHRGNIAG